MHLVYKDPFFAVMLPCQLESKVAALFYFCDLFSVLKDLCLKRRWILFDHVFVQLLDRKHMIGLEKFMYYLYSL